MPWPLADLLPWLQGTVFEEDGPKEAHGLMLLKRGWGTEVQTGRLLLQKLDYLQTVIVTGTFSSVRCATYHCLCFLALMLHAGAISNTLIVTSNCCVIV